ncbi:C-C motif chemokine 21 [Apus apus]|uniref:C-C motif chemokine 21 n=1 Tax=Apus apus TaxID=8895 RepID=UPI0021F83A98|nr:C-C motif chemokine 21 [Apus apus]XP_051497991.1 C-C motif chemokine 21 [Apus apus]
MAPRLLLSLLLLAAAPLIAWAQGIGSSPSDCCLKYSKRRIPDGVVKSYSLQGSESGCMNPAVVIITKKDKKICFPPKRSDIQAIMQKLDNRGQDKKDKKKEPLQLPRSRSKRQKRQQVF